MHDIARMVIHVIYIAIVVCFGMIGAFLYQLIMRIRQRKEKR